MEGSGKKSLIFKFGDEFNISRDIPILVKEVEDDGKWYPMIINDMIVDYNGYIVSMEDFGNKSVRKKKITTMDTRLIGIQEDMLFLLSGSWGPAESAGKLMVCK